MASTITADIDGQSFAVDLARVTGLDALSFRYETGHDLDPLVARWAEAGVAVMLADLAVIKWLWVRQNGKPFAPLPVVASTVTLVADEQAEG